MELPSFELDYSRWGIQLLFLLPALINFGLFVYTLFFLPNSRTNYSFAIFVFLIGLWQCTEGITRLSISPGSADGWYKIVGLFAIFAIPFGILFALNMMKGRLKVPHKLIFLTQFAPAILSSFILMTGQDNYLIKPSEDWYWVFSHPKPPLSIYFIYAWISLDGLLLLTLLCWNWRKSRHEGQKEGRQALLLAIGYAVPFFGGIIAEVIVPLLLNMDGIPVTTPLFTCFSVASLVAILQYNMFEFSPKHQWEQVVETMNEGIIILDNSDRIMYANSIFCKMLGYRYDEIRGKPARHLFPDNHDGRLMKDMLMAGQSRHCELRLKDGGKMWMIMSGSPYLDAKNRVVGTIGLFNDVNSLKNAEKIILQEKERLKLTIEAGKMVTVDFDLEHNKVHLSDNSMQVLGIDSRVDDIETVIDSHVHPDDRLKVRESINRMKQSGRLLDLQFRFARPDTGEWIWVERRGEIIRNRDGQSIALRGVLMDVTERMETETRLHQNTERLKAIFENEPECVKVIGITGELLDMNPAGVEMLEARDIEELRQYDIIQFVHPDDRESYMDMHMKASAGESGTIDFRIIGIKGTQRWMESNVVPLRNAAGEVYAVLSVSRDITEIKKKSDELQQLLELTNNQNKKLQNFAYIVSHNIRSHSANLSGLVDLIGETMDSEDYHMLKSTSDKLAETIQNLNHIITIQRNVHKSGVQRNLKTEIGKTMDVINSMIRKTDLTVSMDIPDSLNLNVVPSYLESILLNLLTNAIKYRSPDRKPEIRLWTEMIDHYTVLSIQDNGLGINLEKHGSDIFGMYKKFHNNQDAEGLGLFIVKNQVEAMNGRIEVESRPGKGSTFKVYFYKFAS